MESESGEALEKFIDRHVIAYCHTIIGTYFWIIIRGMPKNRGGFGNLDLVRHNIKIPFEPDGILDLFGNSDVTEFVEELSLKMSVPPERMADEYF